MTQSQPPEDGETKIETYFDAALEEFGLPQYGGKVDVATLSRYKDIIPEYLFDFYQNIGTGLWRNGKFQFCHPGHFDGVLNDLLGQDADFPAASTIAVGYGPFCNLLVWNKKSGAAWIDFNEFSVDFEPGFDDDDPEEGLGLTLHVEYGDDRVDEETGNNLFDAAVKKCGRLEVGEVYGFVPAIGLGGLGTLEEVQRIDALTHFGILAQLDRFRMRYMRSDRPEWVYYGYLGDPNRPRPEIVGNAPPIDLPPEIR